MLFVALVRDLLQPVSNRSLRLLHTHSRLSVRGSWRLVCCRTLI